MSKLRNGLNAMRRLCYHMDERVFIHTLYAMVFSINFRKPTYIFIRLSAVTAKNLRFEKGVMYQNIENFYIQTIQLELSGLLNYNVLF